MRTINVSFSILLCSVHCVRNQYARLSLFMNFSRAAGVQGGGLGLLPFSNGLCHKILLIEKSCLELTMELS